MRQSHETQADVGKAQAKGEKETEAINGTKRKERKTVWRVEEGRADTVPSGNGSGV